MNIETFDQLSPEWFAATAGNPGASNADKIITTKGERSKQRDDYMRQLAGEFIIGKREEGYTSQAMILGMEREAQARQLFEMLYGEVRQVGLVWGENKSCHASPDGLRETAGLEIKCPMIKTHVKYLLEKTFPMDYFQQVQMGMYVTGLKKWYFMSYYEGLKPFIVECVPDGRFQNGVIVVELDNREAARPDRRPPERRLGKVLHRHAAQQVGRRDRLRREVEEAADRGGEVEADGPRVDRDRRHLSP